MDYSKAKVYMIISDASDDIYIRATCQPLSKKMAEHRISMKSSRDKHVKLYQKMNEIGVERFKILLIKEKFATMGALNSQIARRTSNDYKKEFKARYHPQKQIYRENNRKVMNEKNREYYNERKDKICNTQRQKYNEMTNVKITCEVCGGVHNK